MFSKMDESKTVQKLTNMVGIESQTAINSGAALDPTLCFLHRT